MKFINLNNGYSFDALWSNDQTKGYIFWFPNEQSIGITYAMTLAFVSDSNDVITLSMEENDVFSFISHNEVKTSIDGYVFNEPQYDYSIEISPEKINDKYIYSFNVACHGKSAGEYICKINVGDYGYIRVGADLYGEYEPALINLSNFGVEIPDAIQKAIYDSNVHEDITDNILMNRKFKELISNYWDIIANKGSYKSLKNALKWFEWNDNLKIKEIWKQFNGNKYVFSDRELMTYFEDIVEESLTNYIKTTYISLHCALQEELDSFDSEKNPELSNIVMKWSKNDIQLKISLLAQFFGTYFLPIHMSILHATVEDEVFTNTIKSISAGGINRQDNFGEFSYVECNIKDDNLFKIHNIKAQVTDNTVFGISYPQSDYFGVDPFPTTAFVDKESIKTFSSQYYTGPGVIIPVVLTLNNQLFSDFISKTLIDYNGNRLVFHEIFNEKNGTITVKFNLLIKQAGKNELKFTFVLASGKTVTKSLSLNVEDTENLNINIYKIKSKDDHKGLTIEDFNDTTVSKYLFKTQNDKENSYYFKYMPYMLPTNDRYKTYQGIKLTRTVVVNFIEQSYTEHQITYLLALMHNHKYLMFAKYQDDMKTYKYLVFVSGKFNVDSPKQLYNNLYKYKYDIIRDDLGFYPQFHYLEKVQGNNIENYTINQYEAVCCAAEIDNGNTIEEFRYGHIIDDAEWTFTNNTTGEIVEYPVSSIQPFVMNDTIMDTGYYDIKFRYSLTNGIKNECNLISGFRIYNI